MADDARPSRLVIVSGLPGSGKSTVSARLAEVLGYSWLRIDTIEQGLREICGLAVESEGYRLAYLMARDNLRVGAGVIADSCNPITITRRAWESVATESGASFINVEFLCSDPDEHRRRIESRTVGIPGLKLPTWEDVMSREYDAWGSGATRIDTAGRSVDDCVAEATAAIRV